MPRVKRGPKRKNRRAKILKLAKGYWGMKSRGHRIAKQQVEKGLNSAFAGRKDRKGDFRTLWIARINAAARLNGISYSQLIAGLKAAGSLVDRKILADIAVRDAAAFSAFADAAKGALNCASTTFPGARFDSIGQATRPAPAVNTPSRIPLISEAVIPC